MFGDWLGVFYARLFGLGGWTSIAAPLITKRSDAPADSARLCGERRRSCNGPHGYQPFTVALTGGIATGKSAVTERFAALGASVIDADVVARELVAPGSAALAEIVAAFGAGILDANAGLDRARCVSGCSPMPMRARDARGNPASARSQRAAGAARRSRRAPYALLVIPLLVESGRYDWVDRVLVVDVPRDVQHARLLARDANRCAACRRDARRAGYRASSDWRSQTT